MVDIREVEAQPREEEAQKIHKGPKTVLKVDLGWIPSVPWSLARTQELLTRAVVQYGDSLQ